MNENIAIIGGGPAGISTAIQLRRYKIDPLLFEMHELGGLIRNAWNIENYLGFPYGISGRRFVELLKEQVERYDIRAHYEKVEYLDYNGKNFLIRTPESEYKADIVVIASGTKPKRFDIAEGLPEALRRKILYEISPILDVKNKVIAIVGAGDAAFDYALNLSENNKVMLLNRGNTVRALPLLVERIKDNPNIVYHEDTVLIEIAKGKKRDLLLNTNKNNIEVDYLIAAIGRIARKDFYSSKVRNLEKYLIDKGILYLVGDVKNGRFRQTSIAVGDGINTAMKIYQRIGVKDNENHR